MTKKKEQGKEQMKNLQNAIIQEVRVDEGYEEEVFEILESNCINIDFEDLERRLTSDELDFIESNY